MLNYKELYKKRVDPQITIKNELRHNLLLLLIENPDSSADLVKEAVERPLSEGALMVEIFSSLLNKYFEKSSEISEDLHQNYHRIARQLAGLPEDYKPTDEEVEYCEYLLNNKNWMNLAVTKELKSQAKAIKANYFAVTDNKHGGEFSVLDGTFIGLAAPLAKEVEEKVKKFHLKELFHLSSGYKTISYLHTKDNEVSQSYINLNITVKLGFTGHIMLEIDQVNIREDEEAVIYKIFYVDSIYNLTKQEKELIRAYRDLVDVVFQGTPCKTITLHVILADRLQRVTKRLVLREQVMTIEKLQKELKERKIVFARGGAEIKL